MKKYSVILLTLAMLMSISIWLPHNAFSVDIVEKIGDRCPNHYTSEGSHCMPMSGARETIVKLGNRCPLGFSSDGDYCFRVQVKPTKIIPKYENRCPKDYTSDGPYCASLK
jgi:hypothetical protein